jgi:hypothetical protein
MAGKRHRRGQLNAVVPGLLLRITDEISKRRFLVDTGAAFSVLPHSGPPISAADLPKLRAAGGQSIKCFSEKRLEVSFSGQPFTWEFLLADVEAPLLGADFLRNFKLLVDLNAGCLISTATLRRFSDGLDAAGHSDICMLMEATPPKLRALLSKFPDVLNSSGELPPVPHEVKHVIETTGRPV